MIHYHKPECPVEKKWITAFRAADLLATTQWRVKMLMLFRWYLLNHRTFCFLTWYCGASLWVGESCKKIYLLFSRSRSLQKLIWSKYDNFYCIFWTADLFATKPGLIVHYHKPECFMEKLECVQRQGHSKISKCQWIFVQMIFSELLNLLLPNLVWWCIIMSQIVFQKDWFAVFKVKVAVSR